MSFANQNSILLNDKKGNVYNFYWNEGKIFFNFFDKSKGTYENEILMEEVSLEFDCVLDNKETIYLVIQKNNGQLLLMSYENNTWETNELSKENLDKLYNLNILYKETLHLIYCVSTNQDENIKRIYHHYLDKSEWKTIQVGEIKVSQLLNPFQIVQNENKVFLGYYNTINYEEQFFIREFNLEEKAWRNTIQLTTNQGNKIFADIILTRHNIMNLTYCEHDHGNLVVKYEKYRMGDDRYTKILEETISNPENCSYPSFVMLNDTLWICWTQHDQVVSSYTKDDGLTWSNPLLWKESKNIDFFRHKFNTTVETIRNSYRFNYAFGKGYPEYSFIGFGEIKSAVEIPLDKKKDGIDEEEFLDDSYKIQERNPVKKMDSALEKVSSLDENNDNSNTEERLRALEEKVENMEQYLYRRRRGILFTPRN